MDYQWYPGHMTKSIRQMKEDIKLIDLLIEIVDARIPSSSRNPDIGQLCQGKARILILNKADLADEKENKRWFSYFESQNLHPLLADARKRSDLKKVNALVGEACREKIERNKKRGIMNRPVRAMVAGIPNVGKSTFINSFAGSSAAKTGNKPGVTKGKQWIRLSKQLELLDTPGLLWPKFADQTVGKHIAMIGSMNDDNLIPEELAIDLIKEVQKNYPDCLLKRYNLDEIKDTGMMLNPEAAVLEAIGRSRGCLKKGGEVDYTRAGKIVLDDFRAGRLGRITLERAPRS